MSKKPTSTLVADAVKKVAADKAKDKALPVASKPMAKTVTPAAPKTTPKAAAKPAAKPAAPPPAAVQEPPQAAHKTVPAAKAKKTTPATKTAPEPAPKPEAEAEAVSSASEAPLPPAGADVVELGPEEAAAAREESAGTLADEQNSPLLKTEEGNFALQIVALGGGPTFMRDYARFYAAKFKAVIEVIDRDNSNAVIASFDGRKAKDVEGVAPNTTPRRTRTAITRTSNGSGEGKTAKILTLLLRKEGASKDELKEVTQWAFGDSYIRRVAETRSCTMRKEGNRYYFTKT